MTTQQTAFYNQLSAKGVYHDLAVMAAIALSAGETGATSPVVKQAWSIITAK